VKKSRITIPELTADKILVRCRHQCCICQAPVVAIHHADENPSNNKEDNLIPLCGNCHDRASKKGGLSRNITPAQLLIYKRGWELEVEIAKRTAALAPQLRNVSENERLPETMSATSPEGSR
jgi:5-methylcytosine-specific restriction endonuclease McrA